MNQTEAKIKTSAAVQKLREMHDHGGGSSAEEDARRLASHIRAIDEELEALSKERGRIADRCLASAEASRMNCDRSIAIAKNDYREGENEDTN